MLYLPVRDETTQLMTATATMSDDVVVTSQRPRDTPDMTSQSAAVRARTRQVLSQLRQRGVLSNQSRQRINVGYASHDVVTGVGRMGVGGGGDGDTQRHT